MVTLPAFFPVIFPLLSTVAIFESEEVHDTILMVALAGETVAETVVVAPISIVLEVGETETPVTLRFLTVILAVAVLFPFWLFAVMVAEPAFLR